MNGLPSSGKRAALIIAHPGHELRVHHWLEHARPVVMVLTDGSGRSGRSRLESTSRILSAAGASRGAIYGRFTDAAFYSIMLENRQQVVTRLVAEMAEVLIRLQIDSVAGDALEGYNPSHDLCRFMIGAAVELAQRRGGRPIENFDFALTGRPDECPPELRSGAIELHLNEAAVDRKLAAAQGYPELAQEVEATLGQFGKQSLAVEWLRPASNRLGLDWPFAEPPFYETYGEKQMAQGHYQQVIRFREHLRPLARTAWDFVEQQ